MFNCYTTVSSTSRPPCLRACSPTPCRRSLACPAPELPTHSDLPRCAPPADGVLLPVCRVQQRRVQDSPGQRGHRPDDHGRAALADGHLQAHESERAGRDRDRGSAAALRLARVCLPLENQQAGLAGLERLLLLCALPGEPVLGVHGPGSRGTVGAGPGRAAPPPPHPTPPPTPTHPESLRLLGLAAAAFVCLAVGTGPSADGAGGRRTRCRVPRLLLQGVEIGIGVGIGVSLALVLFKSTFPSIVVLGRLPGTEIYR